MLFVTALAVCFASIAPMPSEDAAIAACTRDVLPDLQAVRQRNAWAARCVAGAPPLCAYPQAAFVCLLDATAPQRADAPCDEAPGPFVLCSGEGLLRGQPVRTPKGWVDVAELVERDVAVLGSWDSRAVPDVSRLADSPLQTVLARPYSGAVIYLETAEGAVLSCTAGQPLLRANGTLVRADAVQWGDLLLGDGGVHHVERIQQTHQQTVAYQVLLQRGDFDHNVLDVGGLFVGGLRLFATTPTAPTGSPH